MKEIKQMPLGMVCMLASIYTVCYIAPLNSAFSDHGYLFYVASHLLVFVGGILLIHGFFRPSESDCME